jgi:hypothetical protein
MRAPRTSLAALLGFACVCPLHAGEAGSSEARTWRGEGLSTEVAVLAFEGTAAFLMGRGVPSDRAREYATQCVLRIVLRDEGIGPLDYDVSSWAVRSNGRAHALVSREDWLGRWRSPPLEPSAATGFQLSQLPPRQTLSSGDSAQGMITAAVARGSRFDLRFDWTTSGIRHEEELHDLRCPAP